MEVELAVALVGGLCAPVLFLTFTLTDMFRVALYGSVLVIGTLVGLEIPLLLRILQDQVKFKDLVSQVLTFDYLGALAASVTFPLLFVPKLGLVRTSLLFGLLNALVGLWSTWLLAPVLAHPMRLRVKAVALSVFLLAGLSAGGPADDVLRGPAVRGRGGVRLQLAVPAHRADARPAGLLAVPQRQPAVRQHRRVPLPRVAGAPGHGARGLGGAGAHPGRR